MPEEYNGNGYETVEEKALLQSANARDRRAIWWTRAAYLSGFAGVVLTGLIIAGILPITLGAAGLVFSVFALSISTKIKAIGNSIVATDIRLPIMADLIARKEASITYVPPPRSTALSRRRAERDAANVLPAT